MVTMMSEILGDRVKWPLCGRSLLEMTLMRAEKIEFGQWLSSMVTIRVGMV